MGTITRQGSAPIQNGETADGAEVEAEFNTLFNVINGNIANENISGVDGTKLSAGSVTAAKMVASTLTTAEVSVGNVTRAVVAVDTPTGAVTNSATYTDSGPSLSLANMTADDWVFINATESIDSPSGTTNVYSFTISIDASDEATIAERDLVTSASAEMFTVSYSYAFQATSSTHTVNMRHKQTDATAAAYPGDVQRTFRALIIPQK